MTVSKDYNKHIYEGNGLTRDWPYDFDLPITAAGAPDTSLIHVFRTNLRGEVTEVTAFSVDAETGTLTYPTSGSPLESGEKLTILRLLDVRQQFFDPSNQANLYPETLEDNTDRLVMMVQQLQEETDRAVKVSLSTDLETEDITAEGIFEARDIAISAAETAEGYAAQLPAIADELGVNLVTDEADLRAKITAIGASDATLVIATSIPLAEDLTIPSNIALAFKNTGSLEPAVTKTLTVNGPIDAGLWQIFGGEGTVAGSLQVSKVYPEWFGVDGIADEVEIQKAVDLHLPVCLTQHYFLTNTIVLPEGTKIYGQNAPYDYRLRNKYQPVTELTMITADTSIFKIDPNDIFLGYVWDIEISNMSLVGTGSDSTGAALYLENPAQIKISGVAIRDTYDGIYIKRGMCCTYTDISIARVSNACIYIDSEITTTQTFNNVAMREAPHAAILRSSSVYGNFNTIFNDCLAESTTGTQVFIIEKGNHVTFNNLYTENCPTDYNNQNDNGCIFECGVTGTGPTVRSQLIINNGQVMGGNFYTATNSAAFRVKDFSQISVNNTFIQQVNKILDAVTGIYAGFDLVLNNVRPIGTDLGATFINSPYISTGSYFNAAGNYLRHLTKVEDFHVRNKNRIIETNKIVTGTGTKILIPITSQANVNRRHNFKIRGLEAVNNSIASKDFEVIFGVVSLTTLTHLTVLSTIGYVTSVTISGMNIVITLQGAIDTPLLSLDVLSTDATLVNTENISVIA